MARKTRQTSLFVFPIKPCYFPQSESFIIENRFIQIYFYDEGFNFLVEIRHQN